MARNQALDITKGIGIILVIVGHFATIPHWAWQFIFSFHMPLFFIVAGYLFKPRDIKESLKKDFKRLIVPYFLTCAAILILHLLYSFKSGSLEWTRYYLIASLVGSGSDRDCLYLAHLPNIGAIWFLPALFVCKNVYALLGQKRKLLYSAIIFVAATVIGRYIIFIPLSVLSGLSAIIFYAIGDKLKGSSQFKTPYWVIGGVCWVVSLFFSNVLPVVPRLDLYFIDVAGATFATALVYILAQWLNKKTPAVSSAFSWLGRNTLTILCFHILEMDCGLSGHLNFTELPIVGNLIRLFLPLLLTAILQQLIYVYTNRTAVRR